MSIQQMWNIFLFWKMGAFEADGHGLSLVISCKSSRGIMSQIGPKPKIATQPTFESFD